MTITPLRRASEDEGPESPESLMISALIDSGQFTPEQFHLSEDHLACWDKLWRFCVEHQHTVGSAPPLALIERKFPEFTFTPDLGDSLSYVAHTLHKAHASRELRGTLYKAIEKVRNEELDEAYDLLESVRRPIVSRKPASDMWDTPDVTADSVEVSKIAVPWAALNRVTGGIGPAELWYLAGRPGTGKTFSLCAFVAEAVKAGYNVRYLSLEMSATQIHRRVRRILAANDKKLLAALDSKDPATYKKAIDQLRDRIPGTLGVVDPSHGRATNSLVREQTDKGDLVVVDHVGLMYTNDGRKAIDDWRAMASISNLLKEDALGTNIPILGAVQLNREAEHGTNAPKISQFGQSDALGQDCDVGITMRLLTPSVRLFSAEKVREGPGVKWWTRFEPEKAQFGEVSHDMALDLQNRDDDRAKG